MPSRPYVRLNRGLMTPGITRCTLSGKQEAVGEQSSICSNLANSVYSMAQTNSSKKPGKCIGRTVGEVENPRKTAIMSLQGRDKVPPKYFTAGNRKRHSCKFISCLFVVQVIEVIKERKHFRAAFYQLQLHTYKPQHF